MGFTQTAHIYDTIYSFKDYQAEVEKLLAIVDKAKDCPGRTWLDIACGTGEHIRFIKRSFTVEGLDINPDLLAIARGKHPGVVFHRADMISFKIPKQYAVISCLFSSIGYVKTIKNLNRTIQRMSEHLLPRGLLLIEPWFTQDSWFPGKVHVLNIDEPELKITRMNTSNVKGNLSYMDMHYLIGTPHSVEHHIERHELGLFEIKEVKSAFRAAGLEVYFDPIGIAGRGLYTGKKPAA